MGFLQPNSSAGPWPRPSGFNPFQGFGVVSARTLNSKLRTRSSSFNPFQGFGGISAFKALPLRLARIAKDPVATAIRDTPRKGVIHLSMIFLIPACEDRVFPLRVYRFSQVNNHLLKNLNEARSQSPSGLVGLFDSRVGKRRCHVDFRARFAGRPSFVTLHRRFYTPNSLRIQYCFCATSSARCFEAKKPVPIRICPLWTPIDHLGDLARCRARARLRGLSQAQC